MAMTLPPDHSGHRKRWIVSLLPRATRFTHLRVAKAVDDMVVDQTDGLHEGITNRRADETKAALLQLAAQSARLPGLGRHVGQLLPLILNRPAIDHAPQEVIEAAVGFAD